MKMNEEELVDIYVDQEEKNNDSFGLPVLQKNQEESSENSSSSTELINKEDQKEELSINGGELPNMEMMTKIATNNQNLEDIKLLTSSKVTDQLKVFLISQARNELTRVIKLTKFLDRIEESYMNKVDKAMMDDSLTLRQYGEILSNITTLLSRSNDIITKVLKDDSLTTILNTTIYTNTNDTQTSIVSQLKDPQSREKVRNVINNILYHTQNYEINEKEIVENDNV